MNNKISNFTVGTRFATNEPPTTADENMEILDFNFENPIEETNEDPIQELIEETNEELTFNTVDEMNKKIEENENVMDFYKILSKG